MTALNPAGETAAAAVERALRGAIIPTLEGMGRPYASPAAAAQLAATAWTEGLCYHRDQLERATGKPGRPGPAYSWFQIEMPTFRKMLDPGGPEEWRDLRPQLRRWGLEWVLDQDPGWLLTCSEVGAVIAARGLYWSDYWSRKRALPTLEAKADAACDYYEGTWRPAKASRPAGRLRFREAWPAAVDLAQTLWPALIG